MRKINNRKWIYVFSKFWNIHKATKIKCLRNFICTPLSQSNGRKSWRNTDVIITWKLRRFNAIIVSTLHYMCPLRKVIDLSCDHDYFIVVRCKFQTEVCVNSKNTAQNFPLCAVCSAEEWRFDMFITETEIFRMRQANATTKTPYWDLSSFMFSSFNSGFIDESRIL